MSLQKPIKVYFASDLHLGAPNYTESLQREQKFIKWLDIIAIDATALYLVGDLFDFWFEYKTAVPKGYVRLLGKLATLRDQGLPIYFFTGNHDLWMFGYFEQELGIPVYHQPITTTIGNHQFMIGHGDGLGPGDYKYKLLKKIFRNPICQTLFSILHPNLALGVANYFSKKSRTANASNDEQFLGNDNEWLYQYCLKKNKQLNNTIHYFIFGHRHLPLNLPLTNSTSRYINLGDWIKYNTYAVYNGENLELCHFTSK